MQRALGFPTPRYSHLPVISNMDGSKMSKRDKEKAIKQGEPPPEIEVHDFRVAGYLPESIVNFIALLGWNPGDEREHFTLTDLIDVFSIERVGKTNARFDRQKLLSFNTDWAAQLPENRLLEAFKDYLAVSATSCGPRSARRDDVPASRTLQHARSDDSEPSRRLQPARPSESSSAAASRESLIYQPTGDPPTDDELRQVLRACAGFRAFPDVMKKAAFLLTPDDAIEYDAKSVKKVLAKSDGAGYAMLEYVLERFERHDEWTAPAMETLFEYMCAERDVPLGAVAQPVRVAITGSTISPSIHESLAMLGKESTLSRIRRCLSLRH
jgi:glutamyl/glutaminyl-tRNA synthetase